MCGILGIIQKEPKREVINKMISLMKHRGPDGRGIYLDKNIGLGHTRLSIIDLSKASNQPIYDKNKRYILVFNGEIYNYIELKEILKKKGHKFKTKGDGEVLLHSFIEWKYDCVKKFIGMFAFAIWDKRKKELFCARDRIGIKPFHYYKDKKKFIFSSEIKPFFETGIKAKPNEKIIHRFLTKGLYELREDTFFKDIKQLPPGNYLIYKNNKIKIVKYWDILKKIKKLNLSEKDYKAKFKELLHNSIKLRLRSDVPIGVNLSGGIDSPSLLCISNLYSKDKGEVETFSMIFDNRKYDEYYLIKEILKTMKWKSNFTKLKPNEVFNLLYKVLWYEEQPFGGVPTIAYWKCLEKANEKKIKVVLEGQGLDELLCGYNYCYGAYYQDLISHFKFITLYKEIKAYKNLKRISWKDSINFMLKSIKANKLDLHTDATEFLKTECIDSKFIKKYNSSSSLPNPFKSSVLNRSYKDVLFNKIQRVLRFNDRLSMGNSVELRVPYLDHRLVEFAFSLPSKFKIRKGISKWLVRETMKGLLPDTLRNRPKAAVQSPQTEWFKTYLKKDILKIINSDSFKKRGYFNVKEVKKEFKRFCESKELENSFFIWQWINIEIWFRMFFDKNSRIYYKNQKF